jgi:hypothetical protein
MEVGLTDHVWSVGELLEVALAEQPCAAPEPRPLELPAGVTGARELPGGRGWLRVVK